MKKRSAKRPNTLSDAIRELNAALTKMADSVAHLGPDLAGAFEVIFSGLHHSKIVSQFAQASVVEMYLYHGEPLVEPVQFTRTKAGQPAVALRIGENFLVLPTEDADRVLTKVAPPVLSDALVQMITELETKAYAD